MHTEYPRFIGEIFDDGSIEGVVWIDKHEVSALDWARLMREAGEALDKYDQILGL